MRANLDVDDGDSDNGDSDVPVALLAGRTSWQTTRPQRTVLVVVHNVTAATRLLDILPLIATDSRIQIIFSVIGSSAFTAGTEEFLRDRQIMPVRWAELGDYDIDLAISASYGGDLRSVQAPIMVVPHGMGYNKYLARKPESQKARKPESQKARKPESQKVVDKPVFGLSAEWLLEDGELIPAAVVLSHPEQLDRLRDSSPEAAGIAVLAGDPCLDRMLASRPLRATYRRALGVSGGQRLIVVSSTWGASSLFGMDSELVARLAARLPLDGYRIVVALHPNIWYLHSPWQVRMWLDDCRRAGVRVLPPEEGWQAALVAADLVIGDHGSVTFYGAALGRPVLLASAPHESVDPRSPIARLLHTAAPLDSGADLVRQIETAITQYDHAVTSAVTDLASSSPGQAAPLLRSAIYRMLELDEPRAPADSRAVPVPVSEPVTVGAQFVDVQFEPTGADWRCEVRRFPAELLRSPDDVPAGAHLSVATAEPYRRWLDLADVVVLPDIGDLEQVLAAMPGCLLATAPIAGGAEWVVRSRDGRAVRFSSVTVDGRICASIVHAWLSDGRTLESLPGQLSVRSGSVVGTLEAAIQ